jgi:hypothetical protein
MDLGVWRDMSLLWLIFLTLIGVLPFAAIFFFAIRGMIRLRQLAKQYSPIVQDKARLVADTTDKISQKVASPIVKLHAKTAQVNGVRKAIFTRRTSP